MKRLLCILSSMNAGGAETFLMKVYRAIDKTKYQLDFCVNTEGKNFYEDEILGMGGKIFRIPTKSDNIDEFKKQLKNVVSENRYEYVLRITSSAAGFMDLKIAKEAGARVCAARSSNASDGQGIMPFVAHRLGKMVYGKYVDVKIAPSDLAAQYTFGKSAYSNGKVKILHNAVDLDIFQYDPDGRKCVRDEFGITEDTKIIGHVGRFNEQKNHRFLIDVFSEIHKLNPNTVLLLVGNGNLEAQIKAKVKELNLDKSVIFAGVRSDISHVFSAMDVFAFPSFYEGMPNTVIEAQACGVPCVISDAITREAGITELVDFLSLKKDASVWAKAVVAKTKTGRMDTKQIFKDQRYDIDSTVTDFISYIFGD